MAITLRSEKGAALTHTEMDDNFKSFIYSGSYDPGVQELTLHSYPSSSLGIPLSSATKTWIQVDETVLVAPNTIYCIQGDLLLDGTLNNSGRLVIVDGTLIMGPEGILNNDGEVNYISNDTYLNYVTSTTIGTITNSNGSGFVIPGASGSIAGLMSAADKTKLDSVSGSNTGDETTSSILTKIGNGSLISSAYLPSYVDDVVVYPDFTSLPLVGEQSKIYITENNNAQYRWTGSSYVATDNPLDYASQVEAEANTENTKVMTALRVFQNWLKNVTDYVHASLPTTSKTILGAISELFTNKLDKNVAITGATKTKVTYDSKGLVTNGADATTADIEDSVNKRYQTDNQNTFNDATSSIQTQLNTLGVAQDTIVVGSPSTINTDTTTTGGYSQVGRNIIIKNGANAINIECLGGQPRTYQKGVGSTGAITFVQGSGRTLVQVSGTAILNGAVGSIASLTSDGTTDFLTITNF